MAKFYHTTASANRSSIAAHGLDVRRMGAAPGIAGSPGAESGGVFLCEDLGEALWYATFGQVEPVDIWKVDAEGLTVEEVDGVMVCLEPIGVDKLLLHESDLYAEEAKRRLGLSAASGSSGALTVRRFSTSDGEEPQPKR